MSNLILLYTDELKGFYKSKVMIALWLGLPLLSLLLHFWAPEIEGEMPLTTFTALIVSSISGTLASAMLGVSIIHEKSRHVYDLFLIRPIKRRDIVLAKFLAVYTCIAIASGLAIATGLFVDYWTMGEIPKTLVDNTLESFAASLSMTGIASAAGVLIGVISSSVLLGVILVIYGGNQIVGLGMLPFLINVSGRGVLTMIWGGILTAVLLFGAVLVFDRRQF
jgi:ABC-2 type transport system permease protein